MAKLTINEFRLMYPNEDACLDKLFELRFKNLVCPVCEGIKPYSRVKNRRCYQCPDCSHQIYPTAGTVFEKTTTPLTHWFFLIYLQTTTRNGVSAKEVERLMNVCVKIARRIAHQIKKLTLDNDTTPIFGTVEVDESVIGGKLKNKHNSVRKKMSVNDNKTTVMGFVCRNGGVRAKVLDGRKTFKELVRENVDKQSLLITDNYNAYAGLDIEYWKHEIINHVANEYVRGDYHTNTIENYWSNLKRTIKGTHISVSAKHLQKYVDEVSFRYMYRKMPEKMFEAILNRVVSAA